MKALPEDPRCPFCYHKIEQPKELSSRKIVEFPLGLCSQCGAVYAYDVTGHNMGSAFIEALLFACNEDDYLAFSLSHGEDYTDAIVGNYDIVTHTVVPEKVYNDRFVRGVLIFIKLFGQFQDATEEKVKEKFRAIQPIVKTKLRSENFSKETVRTYVAENRKEDLVALAQEDSRVLNELQRLLYTPDELSRWRVIDLLGEVSRSVGEKRPDIISKLIKNLLQSAASPGASAWGALEAIGTIISTKPSLFGEFTKPLLSFISHQDLWREVTWAIGKISTADANLARLAFRGLASLLDNPDHVLRGYASWALGNIGITDVIDRLKTLEADAHRLTLWRDGGLQEVTVGQLAHEAIQKLSR